MSIIIKNTSKFGQSDINPSEITPRDVFENRRKFMKNAIGTSLLMGAAQITPAWAKQWPNLAKSNHGAALTPNALKDIKTYNNFYEFGTGKGDPAKNAHEFNPKPWSITVEGEAEKTGTFNLEDFIKPYALEERIYRFRCVEAWSMVVPWVGFSLADMLKTFKPTSKAKYVRFETMYDVSRMPRQKRKVLDWPYVEGLRIDEAMNPLTMMVVGLYGDVLPNQNGAPIRLIVPWKYGFKSIKSIVKIQFTETQPISTWTRLAPSEYGFYSNVNPGVSHPRWSQAKEKLLGAPFWTPKQKTLMFNGYEKEVAHLYKGMDLTKNF